MLEDVWKDLREQWIGELYAALDSAKNNEEGDSGKGGPRRQSPGRSQQDQLNEELVKELHGRRSERLAKKPNNGSDLKHENGKHSASRTEFFQGGRISRHVNTLIHNEEAVVASFCWISCEYCGKLRRVHQPFPGGAPFVCALALNVGSCSVPEHEGLGVVFSNNKTQNVANVRSESILGDIALREVVKAETLGTAITSRSSGHGVRNANGTTNMASVNFSGRRGLQGEAAGVSSSPRNSTSPTRVATCLPLLRDLTLALRKRALGTFVKNIVMIPDEVRAKREEVMLASVTFNEEKPSADSLLPKPETSRDKLRDACDGTAQDSPVRGADPQKQKRQRQGSNGSCNMDDTGRSKDTGNAVDDRARTHTAVVCREEATACHGRSVDDLPHHPQSKKINENTSQKRTALKMKLEPSFSADVVQPEGPIEGFKEIKLESVETPPYGWRDDNNSCSGPPNDCFQEMGTAETTVVEDLSARPGGKRRIGRPPLKASDSTKTYKRRKINNNCGDAKVSGVGRRGRKAIRVGDDDTTTAVGAEDPDVIHWVCCDSCGKWRIVPQKIEEETKHWCCEMRADGTTCSDTDDEIRKKSSSKRRKTCKGPKRLAEE